MSKTFEGKPCRTCGNTERYISANKPCVVCTKNNSQKRHKLGKTKEWVEKERDRVNSYNKKTYRSLTEEEKILRNRKYHLSTYGLTLEKYDEMLNIQGGVCACCGEKETNSSKKYLCVDHCHKTGRARSLLCDRCNRGIGALNDDLDILRKAVLYLEEYSEY